MGFKLLKKGFSWALPVLLIVFPLGGVFLSFPGTLSSLKTLFQQKDFLQALENSLIIGGFTSLLSSGLGIAMALFVSRLLLPYRRTMSLLLTIPLFFLPYQFALGWSYLIPSRYSALLFSKTGVVFVLTGCFYPVVFWLVLSALSSVSREEEEAALLLTSPLRVLWKITLPRSRGGAITGALLVFLLAFSELGVPTYLGVNTVSYQVLVRFSAFYDMRAGLAASLPLLAVGMVILAVEYSLLRRGFRVFSPLKGGLRFSPGVFRIPILVFLVGSFSLFLLLPMGGLLHRAMEPKTFFRAVSAGGGSFLRTLFYSSVAAAVAVVWSVFSARKTSPLYSLILLLGFLTPQPALALGFMKVWGGLTLLYSTGILLVMAMVARYYFLAFKVVELGYSHLDPSGEEAALLAGASPFTTFRRITVPSLKKWLGAAFLLVFVFSANDLGLGSMLYPPGGEPLVVRIYTLSVNNFPGVLSSLSLMNSLLGLMAVTFLLRRQS